MQRRSLLLFVVASLALGFPSSARRKRPSRKPKPSPAKEGPKVDRWSKDGASTVTFVAVGPGGMKMEGKTSELEVKDVGEDLTVVVPLGQLSTGIGLRDKHMKEEYLETQKYPTAELKVSRANFKTPSSGAAAQSEIKGVLRLHGREKPLVVNYQAKPVQGGYEIAGSFQVNIADYGIAVPVYLGVTVKPEVEIAASFKVKK